MDKFGLFWWYKPLFVIFIKKNIKKKNMLNTNISVEYSSKNSARIFPYYSLSKSLSISSSFPKSCFNFWYSSSSLVDYTDFRFY